MPAVVAGNGLTILVASWTRPSDSHGSAAAGTATAASEPCHASFTRCQAGFGGAPSPEQLRNHRPCRRKQREVAALLQVRRRPEAGLCSALANWCHQSGSKAVFT